MPLHDHRPHPARAAALLLAVGLLTACAGVQPGRVAPGQDEATVIAAMGAPTGRYALPGGATRLEYARGGWFDVTETPGTHRVGKQIRSTEVEKLANAGYLTRVPHPSIAWVFELSPSGRSFVDPEGLLDQKLASRQRPSR